MKQPLAVAEDAWLESADGKLCSAPDTLLTALSARQCLENRLRRAFDAGWEAKEQHLAATLLIAERLADPVQDARNSDEPES